MIYHEQAGKFKICFNFSDRKQKSVSELNFEIFWLTKICYDKMQSPTINLTIYILTHISLNVNTKKQKIRATAFTF